MWSMHVQTSSPFHLLVKKLTYRTTSRLANCPSPTPWKNMSPRHQPSISKTTGPVHKLMHAFNIHPAKYETISPCNWGPKTCPLLKISIPTSKEAAIEAAVIAHSEVSVFSDGS